MRFDEVLEQIGGFGRYQKFVFALTCLAGLLTGFFMLNPVFILGIPEHRCTIPGYSNDTYDIQDWEHQSLVDQYIPPSEEFEYNRCYVCQPTNNVTDKERSVTNNCTLSEAVRCNSWVYDKSLFISTFVSEVDLVCDREIWVANAEMIFFGGMLVGSLVSGVVADMYGRKPVVYIAVLTITASSFSLAWVRVYWLFCLVEFILGAALVSAFMPAYIITVEITCAKKRVWPGVIADFPYVAGLLVLTAVAYWLKDWFKIQLYLSIPSVLMVSYWWLIPESPRWLLTKGRVKEAEVIIRDIARWNHTEIPDKLFEQDRLEDDEDKNSSFIQLFTTRTQLFRTVVIFFNWTIVALAYYGTALNSDNLNGNLYLNFGLVSLVEVPAYFLVIFLVDKFGRRRLYCVLMLIGGLSCASTIFAIEYEPEGSDTLTIALSLFGRFCVTAAYCVAYIHSAELFPTVVRNAGMGGASVFARLGSMIAPYVVIWGESYGGTIREALPLLVFGGASFLSGFVSLLLPETLNKHLPDTVQDGDRFGKSGAFYFVRSLKRHTHDVEKSYNNGLYESERELLLSTDKSSQST